MTRLLGEEGCRTMAAGESAVWPDHLFPGFKMKLTLTFTLCGGGIRVIDASSDTR